MRTSHACLFPSPDNAPYFTQHLCFCLRGDDGRPEFMRDVVSLCGQATESIPDRVFPLEDLDPAHEVRVCQRCLLRLAAAQDEHLLHLWRLLTGHE